MKWEKIGQTVFNLSEYSLDYRGAAVPFGLWVNNSIFRIYYTARDKENRSNIFYADWDMKYLKPVHVPIEPILKPGNLGCFDDSGVMTSWVECVDGLYYLYYTGWNLGKTVPFRNAIGLAVSEDGVHFHRAYEGPILDRTMTEPHFCTGPCILRENNKWRMYYLSCVRWERQKTGTKHYYHIKYAESQDGIEWKREGKIAIDFKDETEYAISRPCVVKSNGLYRMWYSCRGESYRIGYAESDDGEEWVRKDNLAGIDVSEKGFDSKMICYPYVLQYGSDWYLLFNGNEYGMTGFGIAKLVEEG